MPLQQPAESTSPTIYDIKEVIQHIKDIRDYANRQVVRCYREREIARETKAVMSAQYQDGAAIAFTTIASKIDDYLMELGQ